MSERTETVSVIIPVPPEVTVGDLGTLLLERAEEAMHLELDRLQIRATSERAWAWRQLPPAEAAELAPGIEEQYLANAWLCTAEIKAEDAPVAAPFPIR